MEHHMRCGQLLTDKIVTGQIMVELLWFTTDEKYIIMITKVVNLELT